MNAVLETAVIGLIMTNLATAGGAVYLVRRVAPWPRPQAPAQPRKAAGGEQAAGQAGGS